MDIEPKSLLRQSQELYEEGHQGAGLDFVYSAIDVSLLKGETAYVGEILMAGVELVDELSVSILVGLLTITLGWKQKLTPSRDWLFAAVMARVLSERGFEKTKALLGGLEGSADQWSTFQP